jgi:hypothetical protein
VSGLTPRTYAEHSLRAVGRRMYSVNGSGPVGDAFRAGHARTVGAAIERTFRLDAVADHFHAAIFTGGREGVNRTLETVESVRSLAGHAYLEALEFRTPVTNAPTLTVVAVR